MLKQLDRLVIIRYLEQAEDETFLVFSQHQVVRFK